MGILTLLLLATASIARADYTPGPPVIAARDAAQIKEGDKTHEKILKILRLLNDVQYLGAPPKGGITYEMDSNRIPEKALSEKTGGACGSRSLSIAAVLISSGVPENDVRVVETSINDVISALCPAAGKAVTRRTPPPLGLSSHNFVLVKSKDSWMLVNPTEKSNAPDLIPFLSPWEIESQMRQRPVQIPLLAYRHMLQIPEVQRDFKSGLTVIGLWRLSEYPYHVFSQRYNLIASGKITKIPAGTGNKKFGAFAPFHNEVKFGRKRV